MHNFWGVVQFFGDFFKSKMLVWGADQNTLTLM